ncbi:MAG: PhnB protein [Sphingomonadales bacterium]|jgi:PhnB protein|nr:PhnB protein [Sphingomonadales bacterium]MEA3043747.1 PhnB protein [Sphingomonadales bacterium]MEA3047440.1 PhnB protein [Sphingomonadales bacterium]
MKLQPYLHFDGDCREAFAFYREVLGGDLATMLTYRDGPAGLAGPEWAEKILHATLLIGGQELLGSDAMPGSYQPPAGFDVTIAEVGVEEGKRIFAALGEGGTATMPMQETFWTAGFGMLTDRFGIRWMINCDGSAP